METTHNCLTGPGDVQRLLLEWNNWTQQKATAFLLAAQHFSLALIRMGEGDIALKSERNLKSYI